MDSSLKWLILALINLLIPVMAASDESNVYVQFNVGTVFAESFTDGGRFCANSLGCGSFAYKERSDPGYVAGAAVGYRLSDQFRLEGEAMYQSSGLDQSILTANTRRLGGFNQELAVSKLDFRSSGNSFAQCCSNYGGLFGVSVKKLKNPNKNIW